MTFIGHLKDSLWSADLFGVESILVRSHWVPLVMDLFTRRITGFGAAPAHIDGVSVCRTFNHATAGQPKPKRLSTDHDPLFRFYRWLANLRVLEIEQIKPVPYAPVSHPFIDRLIGTIRREYPDGVFLWNAMDLARKLGEFKDCRTRIASTARSMARRLRNAPAQPHLPLPHLIVLLGTSIAAVCFRSRLPLDCQFDTYRMKSSCSRAAGPIHRAVLRREMRSRSSPACLMKDFRLAL